MSLVINTNLVANTVRNTLTTNQSNLQKSLARLSSGSKILDPTDDAGGLAVATKLAATLNRNAPRSRTFRMRSHSFRCRTVPLLRPPIFWTV